MNKKEEWVEGERRKGWERNGEMEEGKDGEGSEKERERYEIISNCNGYLSLFSLLLIIFLHHLAVMTTGGCL